MFVEFLLGASGSGKSTSLYKRIIDESAKNPDDLYYLVVPEQFTMEAQRDMVTMHPRGGMMNIDAIGLNRLAYRVFDELGIQVNQVLEDFGKSMVIKRILSENKDALQVYGGMIHKMGFVDEMKSMMSEMFQYDVKKTDVEAVMETLDEDSIVYKKLCDIKLVYDRFEEFVRNNYIVAEQLVQMLTDCVSKSKLLAKSHLFFDGFTGFTPVQMKLILELARNTKGLVFSFTIDPNEVDITHIKEHELFYMTKTAMKSITDMVRQNNRISEKKVEIREPVLLRETVPHRFQNNQELACLEKGLFRYPYKPYQNSLHNISITAVSNPKQEAEFIAAEILKLVREEGYRYRDIAVVMGDLSTSHHTVRQVMEQNHIPVFIDANTALKGNPCAETIRSILAVFADNFSYESVFRFLKSGFTDLEVSEIELLENYAVKRGLRGYSAWCRQVPENYEKRSAVSIEAVRCRFMECIAKLQEKLSDKTATVEDYIQALYDFLIKLDVYKKLKEKSEALAFLGRLDEADAYSHIFEKTVQLFNKMTALLGKERLSIREFYEIVDTGLTDIEIGTVPPTIDRVLVGDITRSRLNHIKVLFFAAVNDGIIPKAPRKGKLLSDRDRVLLEKNGMVLAPSDRVNGYTEQYYIYLNITKPSDKLYLSYRHLGENLSAMRPSYLVGRMKNLFPGLVEKEFSEQERVVYSVRSALDFLAASNCDDGKDGDVGVCATGDISSVESTPATDENVNENEKRTALKAVLAEEGYEKELEAITAGQNYVNNTTKLTPQLVKMLYGENLKESVSKLETYVNCEFAYFLKYGLRLKEREQFDIDARDVGTILHEVMEKLFATVRDYYHNDWLNLDESTRRGLVSDIVKEAADNNAADFFEELERNKYMRNMLERMAQRSADILQRHIKCGTMKPVMIEKNFDSGVDKVNDFVFHLDNDMDMTIRGKIDRVDLAEEDGTVYMKVIDYKSSAKKYELKEILSGEQLQLFAYSAVAYELERAIYHDKDVKIAGLLYYKFDDPLISAAEAEVMIKDGEPYLDTSSEIENQRMEVFQLNGFVNNDIHVIQKMDASPGQVLPVKLTKNGELKEAANILEEQTFHKIIDITRENIQNIGQSIADGNIRIEPLKTKKKDGCKYCAFKGICKFDTKAGGNHYKRPDYTLFQKFMKGAD